MLVAVLVLLYAILRVGHGTTASFSSAQLEHVSTSPARLPYDAARSLLRMFVALALSYAFTLVYGYAAARSRRAEKILVPILDILQSVPVLGFLTITVTVFVGLFPGSVLGLELAALFAIFTAQAWNMTFSFYASLKSLPRELDDLSRSMRLTRWQRFWKIEVPNGAIGLVWNGMMSFGGAWFFLAASEAITLHGHQYSLPGIGSYVGAAIVNGDLRAVGYGIATMIVMVIAVNVVFWRPLLAWSEKFRYETTEASETQRSVVLDLLARSNWPRAVGGARARVADRLGRAMRFLGRDGAAVIVPAARRRVGDIVFGAAVAALVAFGAYEGLRYIANAPGVGLKEIPHCFVLGAVTFARVVVLLVFATLVWVPIGVWIGLSPRVSRVAQPIVQVLASFPANFLFPFATLAFIHLGRQHQHRRDPADGSGCAVVHPVQRDRRRICDPVRPARGDGRTRGQRMAAVEASDHPGHPVLVRDGRDHRRGRGVERLDRRRGREVSPHNAHRDRSRRLHRRGQQRGKQGQADLRCLGDGRLRGRREPPAVATAVPPGRDAVLALSAGAASMNDR